MARSDGGLEVSIAGLWRLATRGPGNTPALLTSLTSAATRFKSPRAKLAMPTSDLDLLCINTVRTLSMDAVQKADSGHPGTPMALAPLGYVLFTRTMRHDPADPQWPDRDRFVLSCGHASMLLYSCLYLSGYDLTLDDLKQFRQWGSSTPGHPEYGHTPGVETTTGPLGQGIGNAVGMAVAEAHLAATFNKPDNDIVDHYTYFICSDGDLMEGISHEAASFAGHFKLGKLIGFYDDNHITIDGSTDLTFTDDTANASRPTAGRCCTSATSTISIRSRRAIAEAQSDTERPTLVDHAHAHRLRQPEAGQREGARRSARRRKRARSTKKNFGWPSTEPFFVPRCRARALAEDEGERRRRARRSGTSSGRPTPRRTQTTPRNSIAVSPASAPPDGRRRSRRSPRTTATSRAAPHSARCSTRPPSHSRSSSAVRPTSRRRTTRRSRRGRTSRRPTTPARYVHFGIREHGMGAIMNGHGAARRHSAVRRHVPDLLGLHAPADSSRGLMKQHVIYIYTHDSIGLGEDGPTHQPIEQLSALRAIPDMTVIRPADANETAVAWRMAVEHDRRPGRARAHAPEAAASSIATMYGSAEGVTRGAYVLADPPSGTTPQVVLLSSGSEVALIMQGAPAARRAGHSRRAS